MNDEEIKLLKEFTRLPHYFVFKKALDSFITDLKDVSNITLEGDIAAQALGRMYAAETLLKFLGTLGVYTEQDTNKNKTYE